MHAQANVDRAGIAHAQEIKMKQFIKRIFGIEKLEKITAEAEARISELKVKEEEATVETEARIAELKVREEEAVKSQQAAKESERVAKMTPKERASLKGEPWVAVLDTHVNKDNIRNGFFELDWNAEFVLQLKQSGYGLEGDPEEEIVDRWFRDLAGNMLSEAGQAEPSKTIGGYINVNRLGNGKAEVE